MNTYIFESPDYPRSPFDPESLRNGFLRIPEKPGVYIWGYLVEINRKMRFCPVNVGQTDDLRRRLYSDHYLGNMPVRSKNRKEEKEIFEFQRTMSLKDVQETYSVMEQYDATPSSKRNPCKNKGCTCFFCKRGIHKNLLLFFRGFDNLNNMQSHKIRPTLVQGILDKKGDIKLYDLYSLLASQKVEHPLCARIEKFYALHKRRFFCVFLHDTDDKQFLADMGNRKTIENEVKKILSQELGIFTTATAAKVAKVSNEVDLTCVKHKLIGLKKGRDKKYVNRNNNYHKKGSLILPKLIEG